MDVFIVACLTVLILTFLLYKNVFKTGKSPPGPTPLPFIGNLLYIARQDPVNFIALHKISKKYGEIISLRIGSISNVLVASSEAAKHLYSRQDCLNRPVNGTIWERTLRQNIGMAFSNNEDWTEIRKFTSRAMRDYGFGNRNEMEKLIKNELENLVNYIKEEASQTADEVIHFDKYFQASFLNLMSSMITGKRRSYNDEEFVTLLKASNSWFEAPLVGILTTMAFPWTRFVFPKLLGYEQQMNALQIMHSCCRVFFPYLLTKMLAIHRQKTNFLDDPKCFTDSFLKMAYEQRDNPASIYTDDQFAVLCIDLLQGGSDTTSNWMSFALLHLVRNPDVHEKLVEEIKKVIGFDRAPELKDRDSMSYTQAVMYEIHRFARLTVIMPPRATRENISYKGYEIKKGTTIMVNLHSCYMDEDVWEEPDEFRPERFLTKDGQIIHCEKMSIVFGAGRRICFGEQMAKDASFLYLVTLMQKFYFRVSPNHPIPDAEPSPGIILRPKPFYVQVRCRAPVQ